MQDKVYAGRERRGRETIKAGLDLPTDSLSESSGPKPMSRPSPTESFLSTRAESSNSHDSKHSGQSLQNSILLHPEKCLGKTPRDCEENRKPMPDALSQSEPTPPTELTDFIQYFLEDFGTLYPITRESDVRRVTAEVQSHGYRDNVESCFVLLIVALSKAYQSPDSPSSGLSEFQQAGGILVRINARIAIDYVQVQLFNALFLLKKARLVNFQMALHICCSALYSLAERCVILNRYLKESNSVNASVSFPKESSNITSQDWDSVLCMFWLCYNLERFAAVCAIRGIQSRTDSCRETIVEIGQAYPKSALHLLENELPLPGRCGPDRSPDGTLPARVRESYHFYLAEISLRAILACIATDSCVRSCVKEEFNYSLTTVAPLVQEFRTQLTEWLSHLPAFLGWSQDPLQGSSSAVGTRLKLTYWFARFTLSEKILLQALQKPHPQLSTLSWVMFKDGLTAAIKMIQVFVMEEADADIIVGLRSVSWSNPSSYPL